VRLLPPEKASKTLKVGEFTRARIVAAEGHDLVACRSEPEPTMSDFDPTALIHHPYRAAGGLRGAADRRAQGVDGDLPDTAACARATGATRTATPTACTARRPPSRWKSASHARRRHRNACWCPAGWRPSRSSTWRLLSQGDEVLLPDNVYGPSRELARTNWRAGASRTALRPAGRGGLAAMIGPRTKLVWLEAAGSVTMEFPDLPAWCRWRAARGVTTALDNTWGAGIAFAPSSWASTS
jgi:cystathionine beta-lyase